MATQKQRKLERQADRIIAQHSKRSKCAFCGGDASQARYVVTQPGTTHVLPFCSTAHFNEWMHHYPQPKIYAPMMTPEQRRAKEKKRTDGLNRRTCPVCKRIASSATKFTITLPGTDKVLVFCQQAHLDHWKHEHPFPPA